VLSERWKVLVAARWRGAYGAGSALMIEPTLGRVVGSAACRREHAEKQQAELAAYQCEKPLGP
jgi:hypothetical protein